MTVSAVEVRKVRPIRVAYLRGQLAAIDEQCVLWGDLMTFVLGHGIEPRGPTIAKYFSMNPIDVAACVPLDPTDVLPPHDRIVDTELEEALMAVYTHRGAMEDIASAYDVILPWVETSKEYVRDGSSREVYVKVPMSADIASGDWANVVVEIHVPIRAVSSS
ncbi:unnamed protein product [Aphanomyces euteiches]|nr:hypothetical protein AeRB84_016571 [Aphanomyces euteiches]